MSVKTESGSLKVTFKKCGRTYVVKRAEGRSCEGCIADITNVNLVRCVEFPTCTEPDIVFLREIK